MELFRAIKARPYTMSPPGVSFRRGLIAIVLKCCLHDLGRLGGLYRVGSFDGLAVCLALVALALQKFILGMAKEKQ
jgi:uncharacterized membrane protein